MDTSELRYTDKFIGDDKISTICDKIRQSDTRKLALRGNNLGPYGAKTIADCLSDNDSLQELSLEWNLIGSMGTEHIAKALEINRSLTHLDLRNNQIGSDAAIALAEVLKTNMILTTLDVRWNQIEDRGALAFKYALLERRPKLQLLITGNKVSESVMSTLFAWMNQETLEFPTHSKPTEVPEHVSSELLLRDIEGLRRELQGVYRELEELRRTYTQSVMKTTELENALCRETYRYTTLHEQYQAALLRISILN
ncbi:hypothetical protein EON65_49840, partial [archaeon]